NNFRQNKQPGLEFAAADAVVSVAGVCTTGGVRYCVTVTNVGEAPYPSGALVELVANPTGASQVLGMFSTTRALAPAQSEFFTWQGPASMGATPVVARVQSGAARECRTSNNTSAPTLACAGSPCVGPGCEPCVAGRACTSNPTPCREGRTTCVGGMTSCADTAAARPEGVSCGPGQVCAAGSCTQQYTVQLTTSRNDVDLAVLLRGAPYGWNGVTPVFVSVTIAPGVVIGATSTAAPAFSTGALPQGSRVRLINRGRIQGKGGNGGIGGGQITLCHPQRNGEAGGVALRLTVPTQLDNTTGALFGGGGGGGGGCNVCGTQSGGGGGGGGAGALPGAGANGGGGPSRPGAQGTDTAGGPGGSDQCGGAGTGATGGAPGLPGQGVSNGSGSSTGGAAGAAIVGQAFVTDVGAAAGDRRGPRIP
ncbi:MAG: hypothetical protein INH37_25985, partial [Myxococcaceae bacterium]|nr:hypothetical protein [Myxococcaceae bacterium]